MRDSFFVAPSVLNGQLLSFDVYRECGNQKPRLVGRVGTFTDDDPRMALLAAYKIKFDAEGPVMPVTDGFEYSTEM